MQSILFPKLQVYRAVYHKDQFLILFILGILFQSNNVKDIEKQLNEDFANICDWFVDKKTKY